MSDWNAVHERGVLLGKRRARQDHEELCWMVEALELELHRRLGYGSFAAYVEAVLGCERRTARDRTRVAQRLRELPRVAEALRDGEILWGAVRELVRVAVPETEAVWVEATKGKPGSVVQRMVSGLEPGDRPGDRKKAEDAVLRFEVMASTKALFLEAQAKLAREAGQSLDDDELVLAMARAVLEGPREEGRASYQVQMTVCEECGGGRQQAGGEQVPVEEPAVAAAMCDAQVVPTLEVAPGATRVDDSKVAPGATPSPRRATQRVPKSVRARVVRRDGGRCAVPGCGNHLWLDVHHTEPLADGGDHDPDRLCTLCGPHHRAAHEGRPLWSRAGGGVQAGGEEGGVALVRHPAREHSGAVASQAPIRRRGATLDKYAATRPSSVSGETATRTRASPAIGIQGRALRVVMPDCLLLLSITRVPEAAATPKATPYRCTRLTSDRNTARP